MDLFAFHNVNSVLEAGLDVFGFKSRIVITNYRLGRNAVANQFQNCLNGNSRAGYARLAEVDFRADMDSTHRLNLYPSRWKAQVDFIPNGIRGRELTVRLCDKSARDSSIGSDPEAAASHW